jgi:hypothetical protein
MAEKKTKKPVEAAQEGAKKARAARQTANAKSVWTFVPEKKRTEEQQKVKLAPQAQVIVDTIKEFAPITTEDLIKKMDEQQKLITRQPRARILAYYKKDITEKSGACVCKAA